MDSENYAISWCMDDPRAGFSGTETGVNIVVSGGRDVGVG